MTDQPELHATGVGPVLPEERIPAIDVLRGWAMFGVLWSNLNDWYGVTKPVTAFDRGLAWAQHWLVESRFYTLLAILFGVGFGLQLIRASRRHVHFMPVYYRRSAALFVIGVLHAMLLWHGDIVAYYALAAFTVLVFRDLSPRALLIAAAFMLLIVPEIIPRMLFVTGYPVPGPRAPTANADWIFAHGSWDQIAVVRAQEYASISTRLVLGLYWSILGRFLVGLWAVKSGFLRRVTEDRRTMIELLMWSLVMIVVGSVWAAWFPRLWPPGGPWTEIDARFWAPRRLAVNILNWSAEGVALTYAAVILLIFQTPLGARLLRPLAATGRMALTTYLTQSVVCTLLFYGFGFGLYGKTGYTGMFIVTMALFITQMVASTWWLKRFQFGPAEWVWRAMTYGRVPRMRVSNTLVNRRAPPND